ncbi:hypothetical protein BDW16_2427 [Sphingomonas koreensis]|nr:hypothetical protein BDW16_2427 [Sphingomonas koreensis]
MAQENSGSAKPRVVFDVKMPRYEYRKGEDRSMSVDRPRKGEAASADCLANLTLGT